MDANENFEEWAVLELFGHQKLSGLVKSVTVGAAPFIRVDVFDKDGNNTLTRFLNPAAIYSMTPVVKEVAVAYSSRIDAAPVHRWELPALPAPGESVDAEVDEEEDFEE